MALLKAKLDGESYSIDPDSLTLGESLILKRDHGMVDLSEFNFFEPEQLIGVLSIAVRRKHPDWADSDIRTKIEGLPNGPIFAEINRQAEAAMQADPLFAGANEHAPAAGSRATTRKKSGARKSAGSTA